ncbi:MAG: ATP-binding protein [Candidatus Omnitrophota bacterium]
MLKIDMKLMKDILQSKPLVVIDRVIEFSLVVPEEEINPVLELFCDAISKKLNLSSESEFITKSSETIFEQNLSQENKQFVAICLLRMLSANDKFLQKDVNFRANVFKLFDNVFLNEVYIKLGILPSSQTYEKENRLKDLVPVIESELDALLSSFNNMESLPNFSQRFISIIRSKRAKRIIWPFCPKELLDVRLIGLFRLAKEYFEAKGDKAVQVFEKVKSSFTSFINIADEFGTKYSKNYLGELAKKLRLLIVESFNESPLTKSTNVVIRPSIKKYPFWAVGKIIKLSFIVENLGPGYAFNVNLGTNSEIQIDKEKIYLGNLEPGLMTIEIPATINQVSDSVNIKIRLSWNNFDKTEQIQEFDFKLDGQRSNIKWDEIAKEDPYSLEPISTEGELVGRDEIIRQLKAQAQADSIGSSYVYGQKRVGKTSIVKTLKMQLNKLHSQDYMAIYLEAGDYIDPDSRNTIKNLGRKICKEIKESDLRFKSLEIPFFESALSPLSDFLQETLRIVSNLRILFILDEFDELPIELYKRGSIGDAFFQTIRGISNKKSFGFVLVGGEKMEHILSCQGDVLNKFQPIRVDYFDREQHWHDFEELVRRPVADWFEIPDNALFALYDQTAGNPYFTKLICRSIFKIMLERKDSFIAELEVKEAMVQALHVTGSNSFQHFWEDDIFEVGDKAEVISMNRRKVLLALTEVFRQHPVAKREQVLAQAKNYGVELIIESELRELERRKVLISGAAGYKCKVHFFEEWLKEKGVNEIITTFTDLDSILLRKKQEEEAYVRSDEVVRLVNNWGTYKGRLITEDRVRAWLGQFGDNSSQRLAFCILQNIRFYSNDKIRAKLKEAHGIVVRGLVQKYEEKQRKVSNIAVSYLDGVGKSGAEFARLYADENSIYYKNIIEPNEFERLVKNNNGIQVLVFVDDFMGTGNSAKENFNKLFDKYSVFLKSIELQMFYVAIAGFQVAKVNLENELSKLNFSVKVHVCDPLDDSAKCFIDKSQIFPNQLEREKAKELCSRLGTKLLKEAPLGYGDCQATVVFEESCPNNCLPILWEEGSDWDPLFKRL